MKSNHYFTRAVKAVIVIVISALLSGQIHDAQAATIRGLRFQRACRVTKGFFVTRGYAPGMGACFWGSNHWSSVQRQVMCEGQRGHLFTRKDNRGKVIGFGCWSAGL